MLWPAVEPDGIKVDTLLVQPRAKTDKLISLIRSEAIGWIVIRDKIMED